MVLGQLHLAYLHIPRMGRGQKVRVFYGLLLLLWLFRLRISDMVCYMGPRGWGCMAVYLFGLDAEW